MGIIVGGILPALLFGFSGICQKWSSQHGISTGAYLVFIGLGVVSVGAVLWLMNSNQQFSIASTVPALGLGISWGLGALGVALGISKYGAPLAKLVPLYNMNTLVAVLLALVIFSEWREVHLVKLSIGAVMIIAGGILVSS